MAIKTNVNDLVTSDGSQLVITVIMVIKMV